MLSALPLGVLHEASGLGLGGAAHLRGIVVGVLAGRQSALVSEGVMVRRVRLRPCAHLVGFLVSPSQDRADAFAESREGGCRRLQFLLFKSAGPLDVAFDLAAQLTRRGLKLGDLDGALGGLLPGCCGGRPQLVNVLVHLGGSYPRSTLRK